MNSYHHDTDSPNPEDQKEAFFHFTLNDFELLVQEYGADYVLEKLRYPIYVKIARHYDRQC